MPGINPLKIRITTTSHSHVHLSFEHEGVHGFDLPVATALHLANILYRTPKNGLEALAALLEQACGLIPQLEEKTDAKYGQIEGVELERPGSDLAQYGTLKRAPGAPG